MNKCLTASLGLAALAAFSASAGAMPIAPGSMISFSDGASYNSTSVTFPGAGLAGIPMSTGTFSAATGSFSAAFGAGCTNCATFKSFTFNPFTSPTLIYTATLNGVTTSFTLTTLSTANAGSAFLDLEGAGTLTLTGYEPTPGQFFLSSQGPQNTSVSFSATSIAQAVPEPASIALLGGGLVAIGLIRRRHA